MSELFKIESQTHTYIGEGTSITGEFHFSGHTLVAGEVDGVINIHNEGPLVIESTGVLKGTVHCHNLKVFGTIEGQIKATGKLTLYPSSVFTGQIEAAQLSILPGSKVNMDARTDVQI